MSGLHDLPLSTADAPRSLRPAPSGTLGERHLGDLELALSSLRTQLAMLELWAAELAEVLTSGGRLLVAGNGGSAAQSQHLVAELVGRYVADRRPYDAIALCADSAITTALGNDYGMSDLFARQVQAHGRPGDIFLALSTSGRSPDVVHAAEVAAREGLETWALTGAGPNDLVAASAEAVTVQAPGTATVQEVHQVAVHLLCEGFEARLPPAPTR